LPTLISVAELEKNVRGPKQLVDVRSHTEFQAGHIPGAVNIPLDQIESRLGDLSDAYPIVLICQAGKRARMAAALLDPCGRQLSVLEGGTSAWEKSGLPLIVSTKTRWSLERQVRLGAGIMVLTGIISSLLWNPVWLYLAGFAGLGLTFAGLTDICLMGEILAKLPWNSQSRCNLPDGNPGVVDHAK
jgi:rhodanese-related sulfurtransferase